MVSSSDSIDRSALRATTRPPTQSSAVRSARAGCDSNVPVSNINAVVRNNRVQLMDKPLPECSSSSNQQPELGEQSEVLQNALLGHLRTASPPEDRVEVRDELIDRARTV